MSVYTANCIYPLVNDLLLIPTCYLLLLLSLWWIYSKLIGFRDSFRSKNRFTLLTFFAYTVVVGTFSAIYQFLITLDAQRINGEVKYFIIGQETSNIKLDENRAEIRNQISLDTSDLRDARQSLTLLERPGRIKLLDTIADYVDGHYLLKPTISSWMRQQQQKLGRNYIPSWSANGARLLDRHTLPHGLIWSNQIIFSQTGRVITSLYLGNRSDSVLLSKRELSINDYLATTHIRHNSWLKLSAQVRRRYYNYINGQFQRATDSTDRQDLFTDGYEARLRIKEIEERLTRNRQLLSRSKEPDWSYCDTLFFTVVSLFANNYSDISPGNTTARMWIMSEFILVWFITICVVSLEPEGLARWWQRTVAKRFKRRDR